MAREDEAKRSKAVVTAAYARMLLHYLRQRGFEPNSIFAASTVAHLESTQAPAQLPLTEWLRMIDTTIRATGDEELPLKVGMSCELRHLGMLGYVLMSCATLGDAIAQLERYARLVGDLSVSRQVRRGSKMELIWHWPHASPAPDSMPKLQFATRMTMARQLIGRPDVGLTAHFQFKRPHDTEIYDRFFNERTRFGQAQTKLEIDIDLLEAPVTTANVDLNRLVTAQADLTLARSAREPDFLRELKLVLTRNLASGHASLAAAASAFNVAERTLQRRLDGHGCSFRDVLDEVREAQARYYLKESRISLEQVAFMLGYSEQSTFHNAFKRWTGMTPSRFRQNSWFSCDDAELGEGR